MAKSKKSDKKKNDHGDLGVLVDKLIDDVGADRDRLVSFLEGLIESAPGDGAVGIAEYVAKLADAMTRQHQVTASVIKSAVRSSSDDDGDPDLDELSDKIGLPFKDGQTDDSSN